MQTRPASRDLKSYHVQSDPVCSVSIAVVTGVCPPPASRLMRLMGSSTLTLRAEAVPGGVL